MERFTVFVCLSLSVFFALNASSAELPQRAIGHDSVFHSYSSTEFSKSSRDTTFLIGPWGSGAQVNGQFENSTGSASWNSWTHRDLTQTTTSHWHISDYHADNLPDGPGNMALYCGDESLAACSETDVDGGYGNSWDDIFRFSYAVADPNSDCEVTVSGVFNHNTEPGYDYLGFEFYTIDGPVAQAYFDGQGTAVSFSYSMTYAPEDYLGEDLDEVRFEISFTSDGAWSDADCLFSGNGAAQVDDLHTTCSNGNYEGTENFDTDYGDWSIGYPLGTGDFSQLWSYLEGIDPCVTNDTPQVAFIDDGTQVPGVGPSYCWDWCYGPGGYVVNSTGGAAILNNPDAYLHNAVESPILTWPGNEFIGAELTFGVYVHQDLSYDSDAVFYTWSVRSATDAAGVETAEWSDRNLVYYGGPAYIRAGDVVSDLLVPGVTHVQIQLTCYEVNSTHWFGHDVSPAPWFDNVRFTAFTAEGPGMATREIDLAQDNFPESGNVDLSNLASNNVRFDLAMNKGDDFLNVPGDSIVCNVASLRTGGQLTVNRLVYTVSPNLVFDSVRTTAITGSVDAQPAVDSSGGIVPDKWAYDLPDSGFLFPGDVLHYYFEATDEVANSNPQTSTLPADLTGFGEFDYPHTYNSSFEVHCLPSVRADGGTPEILFWNDSGGQASENSWFYTLYALSLIKRLDYDVYYTNGPSSSVGNGLGGRCTDELLAHYPILLYTSGDQSFSTISNGDPDYDPGNDVALLTNYVSQNTARMYLTGDDFVSDLWGSGEAANTFLQDYIHVNLVSNNLRPLINNQTAPLVWSEASNSVFYWTPSWIAYGGCAGINTFDAVEALPGSERLARFANPGGVASYNYSAATLYNNGDDLVITMPYDLRYIYTDINNPFPGIGNARTNVLGAVLYFFEFEFPSIPPSGVPGAENFTVSNYPNPFNPSTKILFNMPDEGHLSLKIYNVRGELVRTLIDETRVAGSNHIMWDGTNDQGSNVSSGVYFYEARTAGEVQVNKMALVK